MGENSEIEFVRANVRRADTRDLLDRLTAFRAGLEPEALAIIVDELRARGITPEDVDGHDRNDRGVLFSGRTGTAVECDFCTRRAVCEEWGWWKLFGLIPLYPTAHRVCEDHLRRRPGASDDR
jgi:hypothetical protein